MNRKKYIISLILLYLILGACQQGTHSNEQTSQIQQEAIAECESQKYSMFIHLGVYSELSGD